MPDEASALNADTLRRVDSDPRPTRPSSRVQRRRHTLLLVGRNQRTRSYLEELERLRVPSVMVAGYLDLKNGVSGRPRDDCSDVLARLEVPCLGKVQDLASVLTHNPVDEVFITLPIKSCYDQIETTVKICEEAGVAVSLSVDLFERNIAQSGIGSPSRITYSCVPYPRWKLGVKRVMDLTLALAVVFVLAIPMLFIAAFIRLTSKGPVFFRQRRVGLNHKPFDMMKFRTMVENAEAMKSELEHLNEQKGPVFKMKKDPRITRFGYFLRKYSLDELPQLFNILVGDMSLVGPRPPIPTEVAEYEWWQRRRLSMKPGLTCYWQVRGRNRIGFEEWMRLDLAYIDNWSLTLDLKLLLETIPVVLKGSGAS